MRFSVLCIAIVLFLTGPDQSYSQSVQPVDSLPNATAVRPVDLIIQQPGWNSASPDFFTFWLDNGTDGFYGPRPQILIDGLPVDANFFGWQNLNMLPIYLPGISNTFAKPGPQLYKNTFYPLGIVDFSATKPDTGWAASTGLYWGNETGDPGPWIYDSTRVTPNVDRWGPDAGAAVSYAKNNWYGKGIFVLRNHQQTDPISHRRLHRTMRAFGATRFYPIKTTSKSGLLESGYLSEQWKFKARGILAEDENYLFLQPFGREVPVQAEYKQLAVDGTYLSGRWEFNLRYILEQKMLNRRNEEHGYIFDWDELNNTYKGTISYATKNLSVHGGIHFEQKKIEAPGITKQNHNISSFSLGADLAMNDRSRFQIDTQLDLYQKRTAGTVKGSFLTNPFSGWNIESIAYYSEVLPIRQQSFGYWISRGYNFFQELGIAINRPLNITNNRLLSFTLKNKINVSDKISLSLSQQFIHHVELNIPWQTVAYSENFNSEPGLFAISRESGSRILLKGSISHAPVKWLGQRLSFHYQESLRGSQRYKDYFLQIPGEQIIYQLKVSPAQNLALSLRGTYRSSALWKEFDALDGKEYQDVDNLFPVFTGTFDSTVPARFNIYLGAKKWFWERRVSVQFSVQNLLNEVIRTHPLGANRSLTFNIKATASF